jgi:hypothetical protein
MNTSATARSDATGLTRQDRCDRCGAAAMLRAVFASGAELLFCGHHAREHGPRLHVVATRLSIELSESHSWLQAGTPAARESGGGIQSWVRRPG